jgi:hypothetical protein
MGLGDLVDIELVLRTADAAITQKHAEVSGVVGAPTGEVQSDKGGRAFFKPFERGRIYWTQTHGAFEIHGAILARYLALRASASFLRAPVTDEKPIPETEGAFNHFEGGSIYWQQSIGAHEIHGAIRELWASLGSQDSYLGYPTSDEHDWISPAGVEGKASDFQFGQIGWTNDGGPVEIPETRSFDTGSITFPEGTPVNGFVQWTIASNGDFSYRFHAHNSGALPFNFSTFGVIANGLASGSERGIFGLRHSGIIHGIDPGDRDDNAEGAGNSGLFRNHWLRMSNGRFTVSMRATDSFSGAFFDVTNAIRDFLRGLFGEDPGENIGVGQTGYITDIREV